MPPRLVPPLLLLALLPAACAAPPPSASLPPATLACLAASPLDNPEVAERLVAATGRSGTVFIAVPVFGCDMGGGSGGTLLAEAPRRRRT